MLYSATTRGFYTPDIHVSIPSDAVEITDEEYIALLDGQSQGQQIVSDVNGYPILQYPPLLTPDEGWDRIKAERDRRKDGGVKVAIGLEDKWFHSDSGSRIQHLGLKDKARDLIESGGAMTANIVILGQTVRWKTMDGTFIDVTAQVAFDIITAAGNLDAQLFTVAEAHKASMMASSDPGAYDFSGGWPIKFGE